MCSLRRPKNWHLLHNVKLTVKIASIFVAFLENMNFKSTACDHIPSGLLCLCTELPVTLPSFGRQSKNHMSQQFVFTHHEITWWSLRGEKVQPIGLDWLSYLACASKSHCKFLILAYFCNPCIIYIGMKTVLYTLRAPL